MGVGKHLGGCEFDFLLRKLYSRMFITRFF